MLQGKLNELHLGLNVTSKGVFKFQRIDAIESPFRPEDGYFHPIITDDANLATTYFLGNDHFHESDGSIRYPVKLKMFSKILGVEHIFTKEQVLEAYHNYCINGRLILHSLLDCIDPEWYK